MFSQDYINRFSSLGRLYGELELKKIQSAHVAVIGIGGVGSWAAEALARSGIGQITLVDYDEICLSNINRQVHSLTGNVGRSKVQVMRDRLLDINPEIAVCIFEEIFNADSADKILNTKYDFIIDAIDSHRKKCVLISKCRELQIPVLTIGGSGGRRDPSQIKVTDLSNTFGDRLLQKTRKMLRSDYSFPRQGKMKVLSIFSMEAPYFPDNNGCVSQHPENRPNKPLDCSTGVGTASFVTGCVGLFAAGAVVSAIATKNSETPFQ